MMDHLERLLDAYELRASASVKSRLAVLMDIERVHDRRVVPFLLDVLRDDRESEDVRIYVLKRLRNGNGVVGRTERSSVAKALCEVLTKRCTLDLRLEAALTLGEFTDVEGVLSCLGAVCLSQDESIDLRYTAFTSLERAGPTPECVAVLERLFGDETLGNSARSVLSLWHIT
jgi:HEAT repeat protein